MAFDREILTQRIDSDLAKDMIKNTAREITRCKKEGQYEMAERVRLTIRALKRNIFIIF